MNRSRLVLVIIAAVAAYSPLRAGAAPTAYYNPATGGIHLKNDAFSAYAVSVYSQPFANVAKSEPSLYASIPGATFDPGDLPLGFTYLNFPHTGSAPLGIFIGNVIAPGVPTSALKGDIYLGETVRPLLFVEVPEPASAIAMASAVIGAGVLLRRHRNTVEDSGTSK